MDGRYNLELVDARIIECKPSWFQHKTYIRVGNEYISTWALLRKNDTTKIRLLYNPRRSLKISIDYACNGIIHGSGE